MSPTFIERSRTRALRLMTDSATLIRATFAPDGSGGTTRTLSTLGPYPCRLRSIRTVPTESAEAGRIVAVSVWIGYLPVDVVVLPSDQLQVNGMTFEVTDDGRGPTDAVYQAVNLREVH